MSNRWCAAALGVAALLGAAVGGAWGLLRWCSELLDGVEEPDLPRAYNVPLR